MLTTSSANISCLYLPVFVKCSLFQFILKRIFILLSLTRKPDESIIIETSDGNIVVSVIAVKGNQVKLAFQAPDNVDIWREEIYERRQ